jgi:hypothetical protein
MIPPERQYKPWEESLLKANTVRLARGHLMHDLKAGRVYIHELLLDPPDIIETMTIYDLLRNIPRYGHVTIVNILSPRSISPTRLVADLTDRQRKELAALLKLR